MEKEQIILKIRDFLETYYKNEIAKLISEGKRSLVISFEDLQRYDKDLAEELLDNPEDILAYFNQVLKELIQKYSLEEPKREYYVRVKDIPRKIRIRDIRSEHIGKLIKIEGIIKLASEVRPMVIAVKYKHDLSECQAEFWYPQYGFKIEKPKICPACKKSSGKFIEIAKKFIDTQRLLIEEPPDVLEGGEQPRRINVFLRDDLCEPKMERKTLPGNRVEIIGIPKEIPLQSKQGTLYDIVIEAVYIETVEKSVEEIEITKEDEIKIKEIAASPKFWDIMIKSLAPSIHGYEEIKKAILLQLVGGVKKVRPDGTVVRGNIHILLVGDPGVAKTQLLRYVAKISPKGKYVSGKSASAVGLCLHYNTFVQKEDGTLILLGEEAERIIKEDGKYISYNYNDKVITLNDFSLKNVKASEIWKIEGKELVRIVTETGKEIIVTPNTKIYTFEGWKEAYNIKEGEYIVTVEKLPEGKYTAEELYLDKDILYLIGLVIGDGNIHEKYIRITNNDKRILDFIINLCKRKGWNYTLTITQNRVPEIKIYSKELREIIKTYVYMTSPKEEIYLKGKITGLRNEDLAYIIRGIFDSDGCIYLKNGKPVIEIVSTSKLLIQQLQLLLLRFGITALIRERKDKVGKISVLEDGKIIVSKKPQYVLYILAQEDVKKFLTKIGSLLEERVSMLKFIKGTRQRNIHLFPVDKILKELSEKYRISSHNFYVYFKYGHKPSKRKLKEIVVYLKKKGIKDGKVEFLEKLANSDIVFEKVKKVEFIKNDRRYTYDLTTDTHSFVANGILVHNTATVVRDEFLKGGWALEAGALVLASGGVCAIDEFDKIPKQELAALHEAMESLTVTVTKANIHATLKAETSVLAAANPKYGRWDPMKTIAEQIDLPPTILNRFDLIFVIRDEPEEQKDKAIAEHIITSLISPEKIEPVLPPEFLRKYIAYAKKIIPKWAEEAAQKIKEFYLKLRKAYNVDEGVKAVPISPRQLEALIRLAEASARLRLSKFVTVEDAELAIKLLMYSMKQVGIDPETGKPDVDIVMTGYSASQRSKISIILDIISQLEKTYNGPVPINDIITEAERYKIPKSKAEEIIQKLLRSGDLYEPKPGFVQRAK